MKKKQFWLILVIIPTVTTIVLHALFGALFFDATGWPSRLILALVELISLFILLIILWFPTWLIVAEMKDAIEIGFLHLRNAFLIYLTVILIPYDLLKNYFELQFAHGFYLKIALPIAVIFFAISLAHAFMTPYRDIREFEIDRPRKRKAKSRWILFDVGALFLIFLAIVSIHFWLFASLDAEKSALMPARLVRYVEQNILSSEQARFIAGKSIKAGENPGASANIPSESMRIRENTSNNAVSISTLRATAIICASLLPAILFFLISCLPIRIMQALLVVATFHERNIAPVFYKSQRYLWHFAKAIVSKNPVLISGSVFTTVLLLCTPLILFSFNGIALYKNIHNADVIILALVVFYAWFGQVALTAVKPDETFGEYFDQQLANTIMVIQDHIVFIGYGSLGKRVVEREIAEMWRKDHQGPIGHKGKQFIETVTPDLTLEYICTSAIIVDLASVDIIYSSQNALLEKYGTVSPFRYKPSMDVPGMPPARKLRLLIPTIVGDAKDPFISSRVNLERAKLLISMIPDERSIQELFEHVCSYKQGYENNKESLNAIICVTRSDQITYLTHRSRSRRIVLVYPKFNQGLTLGHRLWAAMLKLRNLRLENGKKRWPRVLIAGNNKANHYMLETLWPQLPQLDEDPHYVNKNDYIQNNFAAIFAVQGGLSYYPVLNERPLPDEAPKSKYIFNKVWPATLQTSSRYLSYPKSEIPEEISIPTIAINDIDIVSLEACFEEHKPDILVINHENVEKSLLLLSRSLRALERIKSIMKPINLPLILLSAAHGNDWELLNLGDASRYYDVLCKIHQNDLGADLSYPGPSYFNHSERHVIGETISDLNADMEEIIAGACNSLISPKYEDFVEINTCVQNKPGALAAYIARLSRLQFGRSQVAKFWQAQKEQDALRLPSFQYLRNIILDPDKRMFVMTGYATLAPVGDLKSEDYTGTSMIRIFANNGESYRETEFDIDLAQDSYASVEYDKAIREMAVAQHEREVKSRSEPPKPGVPEVIDRISMRPGREYNCVEDYHNVLHGLDEKEESHPFACPGMANCHIAAFQDFASASNNRRIYRYLYPQDPEKPVPEKLLHVRNYYCSAANLDSETLDLAKPSLRSFYARIFCCCRGRNNFGMIPSVLNHLIFRTYSHQLEPEDKNDDWVIDIQYLKDETCHNQYFSLNRLFGTIIKNPEFKNFDPDEPPLHLLRILPIGSPESARLWYVYARAAHAFFEHTFERHTYKFEWINQKRQSRVLVDEKTFQAPDFGKKTNSEYPVVYIVQMLPSKNKNPNKKSSNRHEGEKDTRLCTLCQSLPREFDCRNLRAWV